MNTLTTFRNRSSSKGAQVNTFIMTAAMVFGQTPEPKFFDQLPITISTAQNKEIKMMVERKPDVTLYVGVPRPSSAVDSSVYVESMTGLSSGVYRLFKDGDGTVSAKAVSSSAGPVAKSVASGSGCPGCGCANCGTAPQASVSVSSAPIVQSAPIVLRSVSSAPTVTTYTAPPQTVTYTVTPSVSVSSPKISTSQKSTSSSRPLLSAAGRIFNPMSVLRSSRDDCPSGK